MPLFDLSQGRVRSDMQMFSVPAEPTKLFGYDDSRLVVIFYLDDSAAGWLIAARTFNELRPLGTTTVGVSVPFELYGPQEIWVTGTGGGSFVETAGFWQALYRD